MIKLLSKVNRVFQDFMRPKRLALGKYRWDRKQTRLANSEQIVANAKVIDELLIKSVLFLRGDGKIGDMVINSLMFRELKKSNPNLKIGVVVKGIAKDIIQNNPHIDHIYDYSSSSSKIKKLAQQINQERYDLIIDFTDMLRVKQMMFINLCGAKYNIGINKPNWNLFDLNIAYQEGEHHISHKYAALLNTLGVTDIDLSYDIHLSDAQYLSAKQFRGTIREPRLVVINPYGASKHRTFTMQTVKSIVDGLIVNKNIAVSFVYPPDKREILQKISAGYSSQVYFNADLEGIEATACMLKVADCVISPDTSVVHLAVAFNKQMVAVYRTESGNNARVWGPGTDKVYQVFSIENREVGEESDINDFCIEQLLKATQQCLVE